ncbi:MAG: thermonuclease family protein [Cyanobacteria bacterium J06626_18]
MFASPELPVSKPLQLGVEARDHLRSLLDQGDGTVIVLPIEQDRYDRTVAELFVPVVGREEEIHLNSQMTYDGFAYHYEQYSDSCPNQSAIALGEERAKAERAGVWIDLNAVKPWDYRQ